MLRDWELLQILNTQLHKSSLDSVTADVERGPTVERLKFAFDTNFSSHAPTLRRPVSWSEMLLVPSV